VVLLHGPLALLPGLQPNLDEMPPKFVAAITSMLPMDLDVTISSPLVNDEKYWKRVCVEGQKWTNCEIADHGLSWKQLFFERNLSLELENFGVYTGITRKHEDEMLRPPIDSTHPRWASLYPKLPPTAPDGLPMKERFCKYGVDCKGEFGRTRSVGEASARELCGAVRCGAVGVVECSDCVCLLFGSLPCLVVFLGGTATLHRSSIPPHACSHRHRLVAHWNMAIPGPLQVCGPGKPATVCGNLRPRTP